MLFFDNCKGLYESNFKLTLGLFPFGFLEGY